MERSHTNPVVYLHQKIDVSLWRDQPCFVLGGGLSLEGFSYSRLRGHNTIGINKTFLNFDPDLLYIGDRLFYMRILHSSHDDIVRRQLHTLWTQRQCLTVLLDPQCDTPYTSQTCVVKRNKKPFIQTDLSEGVYAGNNSGTGAISLAIGLKANPIYLLGMDCKVDMQRRKTHHHDGYVGQSLHIQNVRSKEHRKNIEMFAELIVQTDTKVYNLSSISTLTCFPKIDGSTLT